MSEAVPDAVGTAAEYRVVHVVATAQRPIDEVWEIIGPFDALGPLFDVPCRYLWGDGGLGTVRMVFNEVVEPMIARNRYSYTYSQIQGPMTAYDYHGTLGCEPVDARATQIFCTIVYNEASMSAEKREFEVARLEKMFGGVVGRFKKLVERQAC